MLNRRGFLKALGAVGCVLAAGAVPELKSYPDFKYDREWDISKRSWLHSIHNVADEKGAEQFYVFEYIDAEIPTDELFRDMLGVLKNRLSESL